MISPTRQGLSLAFMRAAFGVGMLALLIGELLGVYLLTTALYRALGFAPPEVVAQIITSLLGLTVFIATAVVIFTWSNGRPRSQRQWMGIFEPILAAMEQIAQGDFQVRLHPNFTRNKLIETLGDQLNQMASGLSQIEHMRQDFIANASHEIQSPLTSIRGFARELHDDSLSDVQRHHYLNIIETESIRLSRITENMLKLASLEAAQTPIERCPYRLDRQIRTLILACEPQWAAKSLDVEASLDELVISADQDLLAQVWNNLLQNAIKFTPEGGRIVVSAHREGDSMRCEVTDTGMGIPAEAQEHVFERFYKVDPARERSHEGSGLGLAIARRIVEMHNGNIEVTSQLGCGATFVVTLPAD